MEKRDFFISYTQADRDVAKRVADALKQHGYTVYIQMYDSPYGQSIYSWMNEAIKHSRSFLAVWSGAYYNSAFCIAELETSYSLKIHKKLDKFLLIRLDGREVEPLYQRFARVDFRGVDEGERTRRLLEAVGYRGTAKPEPPKQPYTPESSAEELFQLGMKYYSGLGVEQDYRVARDYYEQAVKKGSVDALNYLGYLHEKGLGVTQDYSKARDCFEQAAEMDNEIAQYNLGVLYHNGRGVTQDYRKAREYYKQAAAKDHASALNNLGTLYELGKGVPINYHIALDYYRRAKEKGHPKAAKAIARIRKKMFQ